jgi:hypothetical protein
MQRERLLASTKYKGRDYWHLLNAKEKLLASTMARGRATDATNEGTRVPGYCNYWGYVELQNHLAFP